MGKGTKSLRTLSLVSYGAAGALGPMGISLLRVRALVNRELHSPLIVSAAMTREKNIDKMRAQVRMSQESTLTLHTQKVKESLCLNRQMSLQFVR